MPYDTLLCLAAYPGRAGRAHKGLRRAGLRSSAFCMRSVAL